MAEKTVEETVTTAIDISAEVAELETHMTSEYTSIWRVSDFLLDVASKFGDEQRAEIHLFHAELSPNAQRSVVKTSHAKAIVETIVEMAG